MKTNKKLTLLYVYTDFESILENCSDTQSENTHTYKVGIQSIMLWILCLLLLR